MDNNDAISNSDDLSTTQVIKNSPNPHTNNAKNIRHNSKNTDIIKKPKFKKTKRAILLIFIVLVAAGIVSQLKSDNNKSRTSKTYLSASECKNIAKNYVVDDFLSLNNIKEKMEKSECTAKDSKSAIDYIDNTYDFNNVAVKRLRLLVEDDSNLTEDDAKSKLQDLGFSEQEIEFAIKHYSDKICSVKKYDLSCEEENDSKFSKKDDKENKENKENKLDSSKEKTDNNKAKTDKSDTKHGQTNKAKNNSESEHSKPQESDDSKTQENQQPAQEPVQQQTEAPAQQPAPAPAAQPQQQPQPAPQQQQPQQLPLVHPGSFCSTSGQQGVTIKGSLMVCKEGVNDGRLRWRKAQ
ncbi:hypothetical protein [Gardnerella vaginalis]|uniref:hypothetical protein n=1 Tax=Gardnerella vaginalis TaxID=2702 RepID=UPI0039F04186